MQCSCTVTIHTATPITNDQLEAVAERAGAAEGNPGGSVLTTTLTVDGADLGDAASVAVAEVLALVPGESIAVEALTITEADRRLTIPAFPVLVGISEIGEMLGVSRQRASALQTHKGFPGPVATLRAGPVWRRDDIASFAAAWRAA